MASQWCRVTQHQQIMQQYYVLQSHNSANCGGSVVGRAYKNRGRENDASLLKNDYFGENPTYGGEFRRRFRMSRELFLRTMRALNENSTSWKTSYDCAENMFYLPSENMCFYSVSCIWYIC